MGLLLLAAGLDAQTFTGNISGLVMDPGQATIAGATVRVRNEATSDTRQATTGGDGRYIFSQLPPGNYEVSVEMTGFRKSVQKNAELRVNATLELNFNLQLGEVTQVVEVTAGVTMLDTQSANRSVTLNQQAVLDLPVNARNPFVLVHVNAGVIAVRTGISQATQDQNHNRFSMNGGRGQAGLTLIDGVPAAAVDWGGLIASPSVDSVQEVSIVRNQFDAQFGKSDGGAVNMITRGGSNAFHGSVFEFLRNDKLDANSWANNRSGLPRVLFQRNQFGAAVGGPIKRSSRLFFFTAYEGLRQGSPGTNISNVPTALQRGGDFSQTFNQAGALIRIFNPFTTRANPSGSGFIRDQFADNKIPTNLMDPVALNVMKYFPLPNLPGDTNTRANNYAASGSTQLNLDNYDFRIDHRISDKQTFFARYSHRYTDDVPLQSFPDELTIAEGRIIQENRVRNVVAEYTNTLNASTVLTARLGFSRTLFVFSNQGLGFKPSSLGLPAAIDSVVDRQMFPAFGVSGMTSLGGNDHRYNAFMSYPFVATITKTKGNHNLKFGGEIRMIRVNVWEARNAGTFNFGAGFTQGPNPNAASSAAGLGFASFLLGTGTSGNTLIQGWKNVASQSFYNAAYFQDDWRVTSKLTLNLGVRYDYDTPRTERYNRMNYFDPNAVSPLTGKVPGIPTIKGGVVFVGVNGNPRHQYIKDLNNLAPRLGLAYQVNEKTVVRAGYSHIFGPSNQAAQGTVGPFGFRTEYPWITTTDGITPANLLRNPYPLGFRGLPGAADGLLTQVGANLQSVLQDTVTPWSQQWNLNVQRQLPWQMSFEIAYVGTRGRQLSRNGEGGLDLNQLDPKYLSLGSQLNQQVDNPFFGLGTSGFFAFPKIARGQLLRPYPQFTSIIPLYSSGNSSNYHALQLTFGKRLAKGLQIDGNYTWGKNIEEGLNHQDSYFIRQSRALADIDIAHRFVVSYLIELPFGKGRRFGATAPRVVDAVLGGWQFNGITTFQSGTPLSLSASNTAGLFNPLTRANNNGKSAKLSGPVHERLNRYFDTSVFSQPAPFTFGNVGATLPDVRNDGVKNFDFSLFKQFSPLEKLKVQFRVEALNAFNTPRFGSPNTSVTSTTFGVITSQANTPRQMQFAIKLLW